MSLLARIRPSHRAAHRHALNYPRLPRTSSKVGALVLGHSLAHRGKTVNGYGYARHGYSHGNNARDAVGAANAANVAYRRALRRAIRQQHRAVVNQKLADQVLRNNLISAMHGMQKGRASTIAHKMLDFAGLRTEAQQIKAQALAHLPAMLQSFEQQATAHGIKVHYASNGDQVCTILYELMRSHGVTHVIKGKSMVTEEIGLGEFLRARGIELEASDLGDLIVHLMDEPPVHILGPSLHLNRYEIGHVFAEKLHVPETHDVHELNAIARHHLREGFKGLKMGLSGVNFATAAEGAIWLVENEGNGRMCTTSPEIYVALCGIEKLVPDLESATLLSHILTPSANGQFFPAYNNIITGPRRENELDGPHEVHIILIDNGRTNLYADPELQAALRCLRCSACMNFCPIFDKLGGHAYLSTYPGPIGTVISPLMRSMDDCDHLLTLCSLCGRCAEVCPERIPLHHLIRTLRARALQTPVAQNTTSARAQRLLMRLFARAATSGQLWTLLLAKGHTLDLLLQKLGPRIPVLRAWASQKSLPRMSSNFYAALKELPELTVE